MIDKDGKPYGICSLEEALNISEQSGLDLVEISPDAEPPVCKVLDFGKYQYDKQKQRTLWILCTLYVCTYIYI